MAKDARDILEILKFELSFLEDGGYGRSPRSAWRAPAVFEDSPICPNFSDATRPHLCEDCQLEQFVPEDHRKEDVPCRFIELTQGRSVEDLYRTGTQTDMEEALATWLRAQIAKIERERGLPPSQGRA